MYENFVKIPADEQQRILNVCLEEFALHRYGMASTNAIVKKAQIPKGTLFYYFGSKKNLYLYLVDYAVEAYTNEIMSLVDQLPSDFFERMLFIGRHRMLYITREPLIYHFLFNALILTPDAIRPELEGRFAEYAAASSRLMRTGLDYSKFKPGIDVEKALEMVYLLLEGIYNRYTLELQQMQPKQALQLVESIMDECRRYFAMLQDGLYQIPTEIAKSTEG